MQADIRIASRMTWLYCLAKRCRSNEAIAGLSSFSKIPYLKNLILIVKSSFYRALKLKVLQREWNKSVTAAQQIDLCLEYLLLRKIIFLQLYYEFLEGLKLFYN